MDGVDLGAAAEAAIDGLGAEITDKAVDGDDDVGGDWSCLRRARLRRCGSGVMAASESATVRILMGFIVLHP